MPKEGFGYISRQVGLMEPPSYRQCVWYDGEEKDEYFDTMWRAGKAASLLACGVGGVIMCILMCTCCVAYELPTFNVMFWTCIFCFVAQMLTFLSWGSELCDEHECTWSSGTGMNITAAMLWIWAANMIKSFPEALPPTGRGRRRPVVDESDSYLHPNGGFDEGYGYGEDDDNWQGQADAEYDNSYYDDSAAGQSSGYYDDEGETNPYGNEDDGYYDPSYPNGGDGDYDDASPAEIEGDPGAAKMRDID